jgi:hypothetical protein
MNRPGPSKGIPFPTALCILAIQFFVAAACVLIPVIGTEDDELLFVPAVYWPGQALSSLALFGHRVPTMLMSYVGADKTLLYGPILRHLPPTMWTLRLPAVLIGALTLWILFIATRRLANDEIAVALVWIVGTDTMFLMSTTFDWGPVAIQHLCVAAAFALLSHPRPKVFLGGMALGLAFWDKGTAIWTIGAFVVSGAIFLRVQIRERLSKQNFVKAAAGAALGALPILIFNFQHKLATFTENTGFSMEGLSQKLLVMWLTLNGTGMFGFMVRGASPNWESLAPWAILLAVPLVFLPKVRAIRPLALFSLLTGLIIWGGMLFVKAGGTSIHHTILVWPWPHLFAVCVLGYALGESLVGRTAFRIVVVAVVVSNLGLLGVYVSDAYDGGPSSTWSDATLNLPVQYPKAKHVLVLDWGINNMATFRSGGQSPVEDRTFSGLQPGDVAEIAETEFVDHVNAQEVIVGNNAKFDAAIAKLGLVRVVDSILKDSHGNPFLVTFHCSPAPQTADSK